MYQWAATLTSSGQNMPFALPQQVDRTPNGFKMSFLQSNDENGFESVGDIVAELEELAGGQSALLIKGYGDRLKFLVDLPLVMQTMPGAIKLAIDACKN
eukprot:CAMPEP_0196575114 /NCGR_PEP_ID=MMETSP1081-20130531/4670_1 /TAXON_ID=36882 /ORGANISM="Pyramimonas amylifera, Strain CCMP720" /LENGTH=98 /DNA_ID=CAMNT_0041893317 /DNA_START=333 /DNA_END=629 /DNA_ORIENTATION=-